jgi:hypothetical protein
MSCISNQRHGIADYASRHFDNDKANVENKPDDKGAAKIFGGMIMMVVMMLMLVIMPVMMVVMAVMVMVVHDGAR